MIEYALVFDTEGRVIRFHQPPGCSAKGIPDTRDLWKTMTRFRKILGGVAHTHPWTGRAWYSEEDRGTFRSCELGLDKLLLWPIVTRTETRCFVWNEVTGLYTEAGPLTFEINGLDRLLELSVENGQDNEEDVFKAYPAGTRYGLMRRKNLRLG
jgi:hypothetical protein